jgi:hypothetical protein
MRRFLLPSSLLLVLLVSTPSRSIATDYGYITARNTANEVSTSEPVGRTFHLDYTPAVWVNPFDIVIYEFYRLNTATGAKIVVDITTAPQTDWASTNPGTYEFYVDCYDMFGGLIDCSGVNCTLTARPPARVRFATYDGPLPAIYGMYVQDATEKEIGESFTFSSFLKYSWYSELALVTPGTSPWTAIGYGNYTRTGSLLSTTNVSLSVNILYMLGINPVGTPITEGLRWNIVIEYREGDNTDDVPRTRLELDVDINVKVKMWHVEIIPNDEFA